MIAAVFDSPVLRGLDVAGRDAVASAGRTVTRDGVVYRESDPGDALYVVVTGAVELRAVRRGDAGESVLRVARAGDSFGEEALLPGLARRATAVAIGAATMVEIPVAVLRRVTGRAGERKAGERETRYLVRAAARDLLAASAFARDLAPTDTELLLDGVRLERFARGAHVYQPGDRAEQVFLVADGLVQLQRGGDDGRPSVVAYLSRGDFFGDEEVLAGVARSAAAIASGDTWCAVVPAATVRTLADRNPGLLARLRRVADTQRAAQADVVEEASARSTQHVFKDLYRLQIARSLLVIDQDQCVRCGHCAWSCEEVHGTSRLIRRGDKVITPLPIVGAPHAGAGPRPLLLPNTCQHCRDAACMIDCPTGAIGRDPAGEVFIRAELCTGCGNCARSCPWENIQMAPRLRGAPGLGAEVAVKCELCRGYEGPACVEACPTGAVLRIDPGREVEEVVRVLGGGGRSSPSPSPSPTTTTTTTPSPITSTGKALMRSVGTGGVLVVMAGAAVMHEARAWAPASGIGLAAGVIAALLVIALAAYVVPKRMIRWRMRRRRPGAEVVVARSRTRIHLLAHVGLGLVAPAAALAHAGASVPASTGGALSAALLLATALGGFGAVVYRALPRVLTRLERDGSLPEDLAGERDELRARLFREASGTSGLVKRITDKLLVPYARAPVGWLALAASGRSLGEEERRVRARIDRVLDGRGGGRTAGLDGLVRIAVELRALRGRRVLTAALRGWMPVHVLAGAIVVALLLVHVAAVLR